jgi:hypothetical protein
MRVAAEQHSRMRVPHECASNGMQRELARVHARECVCMMSLPPPSLLKVREAVEHGRR